MPEKGKEELALKFLQKLISNSPFKGKVFLAGGAIRDQIMGKPVKDIDLVITDKDGGIEFANWLTKKIGAYKEGANPVVYPRFGTAKFNLRGVNFKGIDLSNIEIESVMTRAEKYETGSRKPEVLYADLETDALRRDFTINTLFQDLTTGKIKDLTGKGIQDIKNKVIRTPLDPDETFKDDPLRMMRAVRFATRYNWNMNRELVDSLKRNSDMLKNISKERIQDELNKILMTDHPDLGLKILSLTGLNKHIIPELDACRGIKQNEYHKDDVFDHILEVVKNTPKDLNARIGALFHDIGKPPTRTEKNGKVHFYGHEDVGAKIAEERLKELKYSNDQISTISNIVKNHMRLKQSKDDGKNISDKALRKFVITLGKDVDSALKMMHADNISHASKSSMPNQIPNIQKRIQGLEIIPGSEAKINLPINGHDIIKTFGIKPGPHMKTILDKVADAWLENPHLSREDALQIVKKSLGNVSQSPSNQSSDRLNHRIINPETKNKILVKTALQYPKDHPAYKVADTYIKNG